MAKRPKDAPTKVYDVAAAVRNIAARPDLLGIFGISGGRIIGGAIAAEDVDTVFARSVSMLDAPDIPPPPWGMDRRQYVAATLHNLIPAAAAGEESTAKAVGWIMDAVIYLFRTHPGCTAEDRERLRAGGHTLWFVSRGAEVAVFLAPSGVVPDSVPATLH